MKAFIHSIFLISLMIGMNLVSYSTAPYAGEADTLFDSPSLVNASTLDTANESDSSKTSSMAKKNERFPAQINPMIPVEPPGIIHSGPKRYVPEVRLHFVDSGNVPVSELIIKLTAPDGDRSAQQTNDDGDIFLSKYENGKYHITASGKPRVNIQRDYVIEVTNQTTSINMLWPHEHPKDFPYPVYSTASLCFLDENNIPIPNLCITVGMTTKVDNGGTSIGSFLLLGATDADGKIVWDNPTIGTHNMTASHMNHPDTFSFPITITDAPAQQFIFRLDDSSRVNPSN